MKQSKVFIFAAGLAVFTLIAAIMHLHTRETIEHGKLQIHALGKTMMVNVAELSYEQVEGVRTNGKGEKIEISAPGISVKQALHGTEIINSDSSYQIVTVISDDSYRAELRREEIEMEDNAYLILDEDQTLRLVVFGDSDSKRSVSHVVQLAVE